MALNLPAHLGGRALSCGRAAARRRRPPSGSHKKHEVEQRALVEQAFTLPG